MLFYFLKNRKIDLAINHCVSLYPSEDYDLAIKLQFRDVDNFIHDSYKDLDERYIKKTLSTKLGKKGYKILVDHI